MKISIVAAVAKNGVIGKDGKLPWPRLRQDMLEFKSRTMDHHILMGRKTFESIGDALPGRRNIVLTRQIDLKLPGCYVVHSPHEGMSLARGNLESELFVIGGAEIYALFLPLADRLYLTEIDWEYEGDTYFPEFNHFQWKCVSQRGSVDSNVPYSFCAYVRV